MKPSSKKPKTFRFVEGELIVTNPQLTDKICDCGGDIVEIGDYKIEDEQVNYITIYVCIDCHQEYEVYHRKQ